MAYSINKYNGDLLITVNDGTIDNTATSLNLVGRGSATYGEAIAENFVHLVENFASENEPLNPIIGQLWFHRDLDGPGTYSLKLCISESPIQWVEIAMNNNETPVGTVILYSGLTPPAGWVICDGTAISRIIYAELFAVIDETYGSGDGVTTFNVPTVPAVSGMNYILKT